MTIETHEASWLIGRLLLGGLFVVGGIRHLSAIPALTQAIAARGMPAAKIVLMPGTILQTVAGLALIAAAYTFWAACCRVVFSLAASVLLVNFWDMQRHGRRKRCQDRAVQLRDYRRPADRCSGLVLKWWYARSACPATYQKPISSARTMPLIELRITCYNFLTDSTETLGALHARLMVDECEYVSIAGNSCCGK